MADGIEYNISKNFFDNFKQLLDADNRPLTNVYWTPAPGSQHAYGCVYLIHGYGGSPVEPCMKEPMMAALERGFDVVAIEGVDMSATAQPNKELNAMTLARQKQALESGLRFCSNLPVISHDYNIGWAHSISCRALSDLMVDSQFARHYFNEIVLNNPYLLPPPKVRVLHAKIMKRDPSGASWDALTRKSKIMMREIEQRQFEVPTSLYNLCVPLPAAWAKKPGFEDLARRLSYFVKRLRLHFVLGTADDMADYNQNMQFYNGLRVPAKQIESIPGANHAFENAIAEYSGLTRSILDAIQQRRIETK